MTGRKRKENIPNEQSNGINGNKAIFTKDWTERKNKKLDRTGDKYQHTFSSQETICTPINVMNWTTRIRWTSAVKKSKFKISEQTNRIKVTCLIYFSLENNDSNMVKQFSKHFNWLSLFINAPTLIRDTSTLFLH